MGSGSYVRGAGYGWVRYRWGGSNQLALAAGRAVGSKLWPLLLLGFLQARAALFGSMHPFALPFFLAVSHVRPRHRLFVALALVAGAFTLGVGPGVELVAILVLAHVLSARWQGRRQGRVAVLAAIAFSLSAAVRSAAAVVVGATPMNLALVLAESFLAMLLTLVGAFALAGTGTDAKEPLVVGGTERLLAMAVLAAGGVAGTAGVSVGSLHVEGILAPLLTLVAAYAGGPGAGAAVGVVVGLLLATPGPAAAWGVAVPAFTGLAAGVFRELGRGGAAVGGLLGSLLMSFYAYAAVPAGRVLAEGAAGLVLFAVLPAGWLGAVRAAYRGAGEAELGVARQRKLHDQVVRRLQVMARLLGELGRSLQLEGTPCQVGGLRDFAGTVAFRLCDGCSAFRSCWEEEFNQTYRAMLSLLSNAEKGLVLSRSDLPEALRQRCAHVDQLLATLSGLGDLYRSSRHWQDRVNEYCRLMQEQVGVLAGFMGRLADEAVAPPVPTQESHPMGYDLATNRLPRAGESIPGDAVLVKELEGDRLLAVVSDGMGAGEQAEASSQAACSLLARMVEVGFDLGLAARVANMALQKQGDGERFVTLDAALIDLEGATLQLLKMGAAPSYLKRGREVLEFRSPSWPLGILPLVRVEVQSCVLQPGDVLVMASDGMWDGSGSTDGELSGWLRRLRTGPAAEMLDRLVSKAADYGRRPLGDDLAAVVLRFLPRA